MESSSPARRYVGFVSRHRFAIVALWATLVGAGWFGIQRLGIDTNLEALLPPDTPSLVALDELRERVNANAPFYVLITSEDPALNRRLAGHVREAIEDWPETRWVVDRRDPSYFADRRLLYLPADELDRIAEDVEIRVEWEECRATPGCVNFGSKVELPTEEELRAIFAAQPGHEELLALLGEGALEDGDPNDPHDDEDDDVPGQLCNDDGSVCMVQASLEGDASRATHATEIYERGEALLDSVRPDDAPESLRMEVGGRYRNTPLIKRITEVDLSNTSVLSSVLVLVLVLLQFRGVRSVFALLLPLGAAIVVTLGSLGYAGVSLNMISAFTLAVLAGIGIDFGLHLLTHYGELREAGDEPEAALEGALESLARSLLVAGTTTAAAFLALAAARFAGFSQMGWVASIGVVLSLVAFLTFFPALILVMHRVFAERRALFRPSPLEKMKLPSRKVAAGIAFGGLALAAAMSVFAAKLDFEYRFHLLRPPGVSNTISRGDADRGPSGTSVYLLGDAPEDLEGLTAITESEVARRDDRGPVVLTPRTLIPDEQPEKLASIARMREALGRVEEQLQGEDRERVDRIRPALAVSAPITAEGLPPWAADYVADDEGEIGRLGVAYVPLRGSDARQMEVLAEEIERWREAHEAVIFASPEALLGEVIPALRDDAPRVVLLALLGLVIAVAFIGRSLVRTVLVLAPVLVAVTIGLGVAVLLGMKLNLYNTLVLPVAFGVGVDGAVYVVWALSGEDPIAERWKRLTTSARAIVGSTATTVAAFGSIMVASNPGLASIGSLALITIGLTLVANVVWLPALMVWWSTRRTPEDPDSSNRSS